MTAQPRGYRSPYSPEGLDKTRGGARVDDDDDEVYPRETRAATAPARDPPVNLDPRQFPTLHAARAAEPKRRLRADPIASALERDAAAADDDDARQPGSGGGVTVVHAKVVSSPDAGNAWAKPPPLVRSPERAPARAGPAARGPSAGDVCADRPRHPAVASRVAAPAPVHREDEKSAGNEAAETPRSAAVNERVPREEESAPPLAAAADDDRPAPIPAPLERGPSHRRSRSRRKRREASPAVPASPPATATTTTTTTTTAKKFQTAAEALAKGVGVCDDGLERPGPAGVHVGSDTDDDEGIDHPTTPSPAPVLVRAGAEAKRSRPASPAKAVDVSDDTTASAPTTAGDDTSREEPSTIGAVDESTTREEEEEGDETKEEVKEAIEVKERIEVEKVEKVEKVDEEDLAAARESPAASRAALDASFEFRGTDESAPSAPSPENVGLVEAAAKLAASEAKAASAFPLSPSRPPSSSPPAASASLVPDPASGTYRGAGRSLAVAPPSTKHGITVTPFDVARQQREIYVPNVKVGLVIGKGGSHVVYFQHQSGCAIHIARDAGEIPGGVNYVVPPSAYADPSDDAVTADGMRRITLLGGEHQTMMAADMIRRLVESSAERCDRTTERQHAIEAGHALPPLPPAAAAAADRDRGFGNPETFGNVRSTRDSFSSHDASAPVNSAYVPGDGPYAHMPHNLSPFVGSGWGRDAASHVEVAATVSIPHRKVGLIIGRGGENIRFLQQQTRAHIQIQSEHDMCPGQPERTVYLRGARESCAEAARMIQVRHHRADSSPR